MATHPGLHRNPSRYGNMPFPHLLLGVKAERHSRNLRRGDFATRYRRHAGCDGLSAQGSARKTAQAAQRRFVFILRQLRQKPTRTGKRRLNTTETLQNALQLDQAF